MNSEKMREEFESKYPMPFACGWNSMAKEYQCIWDEHAGEDEVEVAIDRHNDRLSVWVASRESLVIDLPKIVDKEWGLPLAECSAMRDAIAMCKKRIEAACLKVKS